METYRIPLMWQMYGHINATAENLKDAVDYALGPDCPLPDGTYVDDSVEVDVDVLRSEYGSEEETLAQAMEYGKMPAAQNMSGYERAQLQWMLDHGHSLRELMEELQALQYDDPEDSERIATPIKALFAEWENDRGFGSEIWPCEAEYEDEWRRQNA